VHVRRCDDGVRRVESIAEITGLEGGTPLMQDIFRFQQTGRNGRKIVGHFQATGIVPRLMHEMREKGLDVDLTLFQRADDVSA
jgi:pilus assembly protein CpaF